MSVQSEGTRRPVSLVTGGSRGIGAAVVRELSSRGMDVVFTYRESSAVAEALAQECRVSGAEVLPVAMDQMTKGDPARVVRDTVGWKGHLEHIVANAGLYDSEESGLDPLEMFDRVLSINLRGTYELLSCALPVLKQTTGASVVVISSILSRRDQTGGIGYQISKSALSRLSGILALKFSPEVRVNVVAPGFIRTDMNRSAHEDPEFSEKVRLATPLGRWGEPADIAPTVAFLLSAGSRWITGAEIGVDGGLSIVHPPSPRGIGGRAGSTPLLSQRKVALVTGSSRGIGQEVAFELARNGYDIVVHALDDVEGAKATAQKVLALGANAKVVLGDASSEQDVRRIAREVRDWRGRLDAVVSNAGAGLGTPLSDLTREELHGMIDLHTLSALTLAQELGTTLASTRGSMVINASIAGLSPSTGMISYSLAKSSSLFLSQVLAQEFAPLVRVNAVAPGWIDTALLTWMSPHQRERWAREIPLGRLGTPSDVAPAVRFLLSDDAGFITGQTLVIDGGLSHRWVLSG